MPDSNHETPSEFSFTRCTWYVEVCFLDYFIIKSVVGHIGVRRLLCVLISGYQFPNL